MKISSYTFGSMTIGGTPYRSDLIILPDGQVLDNWVRRSGHLLLPEDLAGLMAAGPKTIIAGTGAYGRMAVSPDLEKGLSEKKIAFTALETAKAVDLFNQMIAKAPARSVGACFHLTC